VNLKCMLVLRQAGIEMFKQVPRQVEVKTFGRLTVRGCDNKENSRKGKMGKLLEHRNAER